jgi:hypothetical protein
MKANALNQVTFKITPHDFAHAKSITGNVINSITQRELLPPLPLLAKGKRGSCPPVPASLFLFKRF